MAIIKIKVPAHWPDFSVTSYFRDPKQGHTGAHTKHRALDITPIWPVNDLGKKSPFWFYYYQTFNLLVAAMRHGVVRMAAPPQCPHIHIDTRRDVAQFGIELVMRQGGQCVYKTHWQVDRQTVFESTRAMQKIRDTLGKNYWGNIWNLWESMKYDWQRNRKYIIVHANGQIGETDLQAKLDSVFGDGSNSQRVFDIASQMIGLTNSSDAADKLPSAGGFATVALLAVAAFFLIRSDRQ